MNWEAIAAVGEILGAIAVFASLAYLSIQIRAGNVSSKAAALREIIDRWDVAIDQLWENSEIAAFMRKTLRGENEGITNDEAMLFAARLSHVVHIQYAVLQMAESGLIPDELKERVDNAVVWLLTSPGGSAWWNSTAHMMPQRYYIDSLIQDHNLEQEFNDWDNSLHAAIKGVQSSDTT